MANSPFKVNSGIKLINRYGNQCIYKNSVNGLSEGKTFGLVAKDDNLDNSGVIVGS